MTKNGKLKSFVVRNSRTGVIVFSCKAYTRKSARHMAKNAVTCEFEIEESE